MILARTLLAAACAGLTAAATAQSYPDRPVKIMIGFAPGGNVDTVLRHVATRLEQRLGKPVLVENRPGAAGTIAAAATARAEPDGYTLLFGVAANLAVAPATMKAPPYDPVSAFAPVVEIARGPYVWLVRSDAPARTLAEFVVWARQNPGKLNYASPGIGSAHHLATEMFKRAAGFELVHVPYKGGLYPALLAGEVQAMFETMPGPLAHLEGGRVRALGVTGPGRLPALPDVPTFAEQGQRDVEASFFWGIVGPAGMPPAIVSRLNAEVAGALAAPELKALFAKWSVEVTAGTAAAFGANIARDYARWKAFVAEAGIGLE